MADVYALPRNRFVNQVTSGAFSLVLGAGFGRPASQMVERRGD
jgi:hypothetical protein